jgi:copper(I)-binding protein
MSKHPIIASTFALVLALAASAQAEPSRIGDIVVEQAWARHHTVC